MLDQKTKERNRMGAILRSVSRRSARVSILCATVRFIMRLSEWERDGFRKGTRLRMFLRKAIAFVRRNLT